MIWDDPNDLRHKKYNWMEMERPCLQQQEIKEGAYYGKPLHSGTMQEKSSTTDNT
jgi:hypothetical protein